MTSKDLQILREIVEHLEKTSYSLLIAPNENKRFNEYAATLEKAIRWIEEMRDNG